MAERTIPLNVQFLIFKLTGMDKIFDTIMYSPFFVMVTLTSLGWGGADRVGGAEKENFAFERSAEGQEISNLLPSLPKYEERSVPRQNLLGTLLHEHTANGISKAAKILIAYLPPKIPLAADEYSSW